MYWYIGVLKKYAVFRGRAQRKEYWMFVLFNILIAIAISIFSVLVGLVDENGTSVLNILYSLGVFVPALAVTVRRLHDVDKSGWWIFISLVPIAGAIVLFIFLLQNSKKGVNKHGPNPKEVLFSQEDHQYQD